MLVVENLHAGYGTSKVLTGISLSVAQGRTVALIGANGAGKTTSMRAFSGVIKPEKGRVILDGRPVQGMDASRIARMGLAHAPEGRKVFGPLSAEDNLLLGAYCRLPLFFGFRAKQVMISTGFTSFFPFLENADSRQPEPFPEANSKCSPLAGRSWPIRRSCFWMNLPWGLRPLSFRKSSTPSIV